jgi:hypothetical protein
MVADEWKGEGSRWEFLSESEHANIIDDCGNEAEN